MNFTAHLTRLLANKHTTSAAGAYMLLTLISELGAIWFPEHAEQFDATITHLRQAAIGYGLLMAGDAGKAEPPKTP